MRRRDFVAAASGSGLVALSGCLSGDGSGSAGESQSADTPAYTTCDPEDVLASAPESARNLPDSLTHDSIVAYVESVEPEIVLPPDSDGYLSVGEVTTESVATGALAEVSVTGGYYNEAKDDDSTETVHYDLPPHTARYFLTRNLVRRVETDGDPADPRREGDLVACTME